MSTTYSPLSYSPVPYDYPSYDRPMSTELANRAGDASIGHGPHNAFNGVRASPITLSPTQSFDQPYYPSSGPMERTPSLPSHYHHPYMRAHSVHAHSSASVHSVNSTLSMSSLNSHNSAYSSSSASMISTPSSGSQTFPTSMLPGAPGIADAWTPQITNNHRESVSSFSSVGSYGFDPNASHISLPIDFQEDVRIKEEDAKDEGSMSPMDIPRTGDRREALRQSRIMGEQRRRNDLRDAFERLRAHLPPTVQRASKVGLIERALTQIGTLTAANQFLFTQTATLTEENKRLNEHVAELSAREAELVSREQEWSVREAALLGEIQTLRKSYGPS